MSNQPFGTRIGIGATDELSLRVSVAALLRVVFKHPGSGECMLALERKATLLDWDSERPVVVKSQPFGGALRILDLQTLQRVLGSFHFDTERSRSERDFRIFIRPSAWESVREFCVEHLHQINDPILESDPSRELEEEFEGALHFSLSSDQFTWRAMGTVIENNSSPTENFYATGAPTARIYRIFEVRILDASLADALITSSQGHTDRDLEELALHKFQRGGLGWANAVLVLSLNQIAAFYLATPSEARNQPLLFQKHKIDETVAAILDSVSVPKYQRV